uniref:hypothetical protein n=1 Tax=Anaerococcus mediterraneensis TaxID=1870984 RepID=UPI0009318603|nr:hypothetical protein [Anaerococcus mediterraneensis]
MTLVELARLWKDGKISNEDAQKAFKKIEIFEPIKEDGEIYWTCGNGNSWLDLTADNYLDRDERFEFRRALGLIKEENNENIL